MLICKFKHICIYIYMYFKILFPQQPWHHWKTDKILFAILFWVPGGETLCVKPWWYFWLGNTWGEQKNARGGCRKKNIPGNRKKVQPTFFHAYLFMMFLSFFFASPPLQLVHLDAIGWRVGFPLPLRVLSFKHGPIRHVVPKARPQRVGIWSTWRLLLCQAQVFVFFLCGRRDAKVQLTWFRVDLGDLPSRLYDVNRGTPFEGIRFESLRRNWLCFP